MQRLSVPLLVSGSTHTAAAAAACWSLVIVRVLFGAYFIYKNGNGKTDRSLGKTEREKLSGPGVGKYILLRI